MLISYNWQRELTGTRLDPQEMRERLTHVGLAVDAVVAREGDFVLDVEVPSNRGDCLSHIGIARELAVIEKSRVQTPQSRVQNTKGKTTDFASVEISDLDLCPRYAARVVRGVTIAPSPEWLVKRLEVLGQRPINNVADITNYVLHEFGQPLHAFDLAKLGLQQIVVRRAKKDETIKTLDGVERKLDSDMLVIADATRPVAVAGVMGGEESEISEATQDVLIESAWFNPASVRRTARLLGLHTEASHRFERHVDPGAVVAAQDRCVALICEIAGGSATEDVLDVYPVPFAARTVEIRPERVAAITGLQVPRAEMVRILTALGFEAGEAGEGKLLFNIPSWRPDVAIEEDLVEEIARHTGYEQIKTELPPAAQAGEYHSSERRKRTLRKAMSALGFNEAIGLSFIEAAEDVELIPRLNGNQGTPLAPVVLTNPIIEDAARMRQTLLPGLLGSIRHNLNHGNRDIRLFETGRVFGVITPGELPLEREAFALAATGGAIMADRAQAERELDLFDLKGALEAALAAMNLPPADFEMRAIRHLRLGQSASISIGGTPVGSIGRLSEPVAGTYKFRQPVFLAEVDLSSLLEIEELPVRYEPLPRFPSIVRDVSLLIDRKLTVAELLRAARDERVDHFIGAHFVGAYEGQGISDSQRSVTLRFEYRADDRTLRDEEVEAIHSRLVETLKARFNATVR
jgi:phenylalanyl-tRNA synthetase beta chain